MQFIYLFIFTQLNKIFSLVPTLVFYTNINNIIVYKGCLSLFELFIVICLDYIRTENGYLIIIILWEPMIFYIWYVFQA